MLFANSGDPDQTSHDAASDLGLHCLLMYPLWMADGHVSWLLLYIVLKFLSFIVKVNGQVWAEILL